MYICTLRMNLQLKIGIMFIAIVGLLLYVIGDNIILAFQQNRIQTMITYGIILKYLGTVIVIVGTTFAVRRGMKDSMRQRGIVDDLR
jgi:uncharacterized membrane protein